MISYLKAYKILMKSKIKINDETISASKSLNRVCSSNIYSPVNYPSANNTAFDGYAINSKETVGLNKKKIRKFKIIKTIAAGDKINFKLIKKYQTIAVMTGAVIKKPFNTIVPIENINFFPNKNNKKFILIDKKIKSDEFLRLTGSDFKKKDLIISAGTIVQPSHILAFKSLGIEKIKVKQKPNILFFSTGNEITKKKIINNQQVRDSNSHYIKSLSNFFLINFKNGPIIRDKDIDLFEKIIYQHLKSKIDIIITCGAVSAGTFDFIPTIIQKFKLSKYFKNVAIRPGKPILFCKFKKKNKAFFGLPGNPMSTAACFRFFVFPYILNILGAKKEKPIIAKLKNNFQKKNNFTRFLKGKLSSTSDGKLEIEILEGQESYKIKSFVKSNVWGVFKDGSTKFKKGKSIECYSLIGPNSNIIN